ncbi:MAG: hypothetical protein R3C53_27665 [Pirellulaceae bacterium]
MTRNSRFVSGTLFVQPFLGTRGNRLHVRKSKAPAPESGCKLSSHRSGSRRQKVTKSRELDGKVMRQASPSDPAMQHHFVLTRFPYLVYEGGH